MFVASTRMLSIGAREAGMKRGEVPELTGECRATVDNWCREFRQGGERAQVTVSAAVGAASFRTPTEYPSPSTCWRRLQQWEEEGVLIQVWCIAVRPRPTRLTCTGEVLTGDTVLLDMIRHASWWLNPVWTGSEIIVIWFLDGINFTRVGPEGDVIDERVRLSDFGEIPGGVVQAWTGSDFGLVGRSPDDGIYLTRVGPDGAWTAAPDHVLDAEGDYFSWSELAWTGSEFALAWIRGDYMGPADVEFSRIISCE